MRSIKTVLALALFATAFIPATASKADDAAVTPQLQQLVDSYVRERRSDRGNLRRRVASRSRRGAIRYSRCSPATTA